MNRSVPEILAPAGSMESLIAALRAGADGVYIGGKKYSARNSAANFSVEEAAEAAAHCHLYGARLYLAVNTIISDSEAADFCLYIKETAAAGIDAYIVQDPGAAELIRRCIPEAVLHGSTQMSVHTAYGAELLKELGFTRVVPARELDRNQIRKIADTGIETEIFVHGALCMSMSGQCYMSAVIGSRSANRGCCGQACRLPFSASGKKDFAGLSLKDLSLLPRIAEAAETGADSFKIEGRMKRPEYVAAAVYSLKEALSGRKPDMTALRGIFSRDGFTDGYFTGNRREMFGVRKKEDVVSAQTLIPKLHELYRYERKVHKLDFHAVIRRGEPVIITANCGELSVTAEAEPPQTAEKRPTDLNMVEKQLSKLGDTVYSAGDITAEIDDGLIVPAGKLNELRRTLTAAMDRLITEKNTPKYNVTDYIPVTPESPVIAAKGDLPLRTFCRTAEQISAAMELSEYVIAPLSLALKGLPDNCGKKKIILSPPDFISDGDITFEQLKKARNEGYEHLLCHTFDSIAMGRKLGFILHGGFRLNVYNSFSAEYLKNLGLSDFTASFEAKLSQLNRMAPVIPMGAAVYGRLPLMVVRNCPIKNESGCLKCTKGITDRTGRTFPVVCCGDYAEILNSEILCMTDRLENFRNISFGLVLLSSENSFQTRNALSGIKPAGGITRGLYYRGID